MKPANCRVASKDLDFDQWLDWKADLTKRLATAIYFFYGHFIRGVRRAVIDGMEPVDRPSESIQFELFEYIYHQILRKDSDWVARDLLRERFRANQGEVARHAYDFRQIGCLLLSTTRETMLEDLIGRPLDEGDVLSNANTVIYLGRVREGNRLARAMYISKHRGSACSEEIIPYWIDDEGVKIGARDEGRGARGRGKKTTLRARQRCWGRLKQISGRSSVARLRLQYGLAVLH